MKQVKLHWILMIAAAALGLFAYARPALSQATNTGTVVGEIDDPSGAVVPGASVTLDDPSSNVKLTATTNAAGKYAFSAVPPGTYTITVSKSGFSNTKSSGQTVNVGTQLTLNLKLNVGGGSETVEVQVTGTELQTLNSTVGQTISQEAISSLPSLNHDVNTFTEMQPGVSPDGSVAGTVVDQSTFLLDGGNNSNDMDGIHVGLHAQLRG